MVEAPNFAPVNCLVCGQGNPPGARFCANCGNPLAAPSSGEVGSAGLIGQLVGGRYLVTRIIGEGGMGVVYEAEQRMGSETRRVAVKTLLPALSSDPVIVSRFYRECGIVSQLEHPNTIKFFDFGETPDGALYISMEYVRGQPLTELIAQGRVELDRARHILKQVCGALYEAHTMGIVHRDLKPDNIVLTSRAGEADFVKLLDFGIAARTTKMSASETKLTQQGTVLGTPPYMSPEQLTGEPVDARSDIYSLAVIAYEMLTGHLPFDADTPWQWAQKHMLEPPAPLRDAQGAPVAPPYVEHAVLHALAKKPEDRPATALDFHAALAGERSADAAPRKLRTLDDEAPRTSPMPMVPGPIAAPSVVAAQYGGSPDHTALAPEFTPAFRTGAALSAPIPPPPLRRRRRGGLGLALGGLASFAAIGGALAALVYYEPFKTETVVASGAPAASSATPVTPVTPVAPVEVPAEVTPEAPAVTAPPPTATPATPAVTKPPAKPPARETPRTPSLPPPPQATPPAEPPPAVPTSPPATQPPPQQQPPASQPTIPPPPVSQPPVTPPPVSEPPVSGETGDQACFASRDAAMNGNVEAAATLLRRCQATGGSVRAQGAARNRIRASVATVVRQHANNGNCAAARSSAAAAASVGVMEGAAALASTSCGAG